MTDPETEPITEPITDAVVEAEPDPYLFTLEQFPEKLAVVRLGPGAEIPTWAESSSIFSVVATAAETSLVCAGRSVPTKVPAHRGLIAFSITGVVDSTLTGVLVALLTPLAEEEIGVFTLSTYDTEWLLVAAGDAERATEAWRRRGHTIAAAVPATSSGKHRS